MLDPVRQRCESGQAVAGGCTEELINPTLQKSISQTARRKDGILIASHLKPSFQRGKPLFS